MARYFAGDPAEIRKASEFVNQLALLEERFGYRLAVGHPASGEPHVDFDPVTFGPNEAFGLIRTADDDLPGGLSVMFLAGDE